ncbi:MAG: hypothetical protein ACLRQX_06165 [Turicibacter sanguinis]
MVIKDNGCGMSQKMLEQVKIHLQPVRPEKLDLGFPFNGDVFKM